jgi:hypothetical protein
MNPQARCEVRFDPNTGKFTEIRFFGLRPDDRKGQERVAANAVARMTNQLQCPPGLTNKERKRLNKEVRQLKSFLGNTAIDETAEAKEQRKLEAAEKKLRRGWQKGQRGPEVVDTAM